MMKKLVATASAVVLGLALAACGDSTAENAAEQEADMMVDSVEAEADAMEDADMITDDQADAMVDQAEAEGDMMEADAEAAATDEAAPVN